MVVIRNDDLPVPDGSGIIGKGNAFFKQVKFFAVADIEMLITNSHVLQDL